MKVLVFGGSGMVGQGVIRECLQAADVELVQTVGRTPTGQQHPKLCELVHADLYDTTHIEDQLTDFDACFFSIGVTSTGMQEAPYTHLTYGLTLAVATTLVRLNPRMVFIYVSGVGADASGTSTSMWKRVRGKVENALLALPFRGVYIFRPGIIQPLDGIRSKTASYRLFYTLTAPLLSVMRKALPKLVLSTRQVGQAMLAAVRFGAQKRVLESGDIAALAGKVQP